MIPLPGLHNYSDSFACSTLWPFDRVTVDKDHFSLQILWLSTTAKLTYILATNSWTAAHS